MSNKEINIILNIVNKAINIHKEMSVEVLSNNSVPIDNFLNRCLKYLEQIDSQTVPSEDRVEKGKAKKVVQNIYESLQNYKGIERQDYNEGRTISLEDIKDDEKSNTIQSAAAYSGGGQGFAHVNWNAALFMSTHGKKQKHPNPYWKPTPVKPVRHVDPSEFDGIVSRQTYEEWEKEMEKQKREVLSEVQRVQ